jgi:hypothetical protein
MPYSRVVPVFEEVNVVEQASGEEQPQVEFGPDVCVANPEPIFLADQGKPSAFKPSLEFYKSLSLVL